MIDLIRTEEIINIVAFRDGSLRDVYIFDTTLEDWDRLLILLKEPNPIEFDLDPREIQSGDAIKKVLQFIASLGEGLGKGVFLTEENSETYVLMSYSKGYFNVLQMGQFSGLCPRAGQCSRPK